MGAAEVLALLLTVIPLVTKYVPGLLASITGQPTDEEALKHTRAKVEALHRSPASTAIDDELARAKRAEDITSRVDLPKP